MSESTDGEDRPLSLLAACLGEPARGKRRLPAIVGMFDSDAEITRLAAGWTCCVVAAKHPDTVEYLVRRLRDRLDGDAPLELTHTLDYLAARHPERVVEAVAERDEARGDPSGVDGPGTARFTHDHSRARPRGHDGLGRVADYGDAGVDAARRPDGDDPDRETPPRAAAGPDAGSADSAGGHEREAEGGDESGTIVERTPAVASIAARSRFDRLHVLASHTHGRYSEDYRALAGRDGEEEAIVLGLLHRPADLADRPAFEEAADRQLRQWAAVDDHAHVAATLDWGIEPRPWLATEFSGETLADLGGGPPGRALPDAIGLAGAVAHLHRSDVVHGGIDPGNVVYPEAALEGAEPKPPLLNNVGLVEAFRYHVDPASVLDPRFAAPEYYDRRFGTVDAATDIYGLGAVIFHLYTGRPPFVGSVGEVRQQVTGDRTPVPGDVADGVPGAIDDVVARAMAPEKLRRYEAVELLAGELRSLEEGGDL